MGRKLIPDGLRRKTVGISFPLDIIAHLDKKSHESGLNRSRYIEAIVRASMVKGQSTLRTYTNAWECSRCSHFWRTREKGLNFVYCPNCTKLQDKLTEFKGQRFDDEEE